ncbi:uncharacterized protein N7484_007114 [Penicillium longicatenatum]|uniref:uncharacterized protein n=1 Tax=Penicillium longicatenatum TaxID=1561947 RepID=UPI002548ED8A|nr:uncharacterized protein N7484_007114 [Penicillium longicatenatum]KAJ5639252.1 hypothetical protein N7484_007114 [Penicillium longicatenatum]
MSSPYRKGFRSPKSPRTAARLNGLYKENAWYCNCPDREPAVRFQVKKEGPNRGRWFYTCHKPQGQRCTFFLWNEEAELREKTVVMANSDSEPDPRSQSQSNMPSTPTKSTQRSNGLFTPQTDHRIIDVPPRHSASKPATTSMTPKARMMAEDNDEFGWDLDSDDNAKLTQASQYAEESFMSQPNFHAGSPPSKAPRTPRNNSPGKRKLSDYVHEPQSTQSSPYFGTPGTSSASSFRPPPASAELCMTPTPKRYRDTDILTVDSRSDESDLAKELLSIFKKHEVVMSNEARDEFVSRVNLEDSRYKGALRARDLLREAMKKKDKEILELKERNTNLKAQAEMVQNMVNSFHE